MTPASGLAGCGGWDDAATAARYRRFEERHGRYRRANAALARHAALRPGLKVLDLAAGTGGTTLALLPALGPHAVVHCVEPAAAMAQAGRLRLGDDSRVRWLATLDAADTDYERIVCGAALWQWTDLPPLLHALAARLRPGGALVFNVPAAYLGQPDGPGGGSDPLLSGLHAALLQRHPGAHAACTVAPPAGTRTVADLEAGLRDAGLRPLAWRHRQRLSQAAWCDWMKLPVLTAALWPGVPAEERDRRIDEAAATLDAASWRAEQWLGWTAWKPAFPLAMLADASPLLRQPDALRRQADRDGVLLLRGVLPKAPLAALRRQLQAAARAEGLLDGRGRWTAGAAPAPHEVPNWTAVQQRMGLQAAFQALVHDARLIAVVSLLLGRPAEGGRGSVCRLAPPDHVVAATAAHRDADFLPDSRGVWGVWIPLADCAVADGVLAVAPGSQQGDDGIGFAAAGLRPGDVLLLSAQTRHRACPNLRPQRVRLSIDLRFGPAPA